ncbi:facilitated trehalose transporter Tret1-like [Pseudomyrmex gracilis]|uniref:facilitated trehalose transporter Tret1-like n=1 Tax=Pseudomyrmex gracilis TaxID=219809 RepID=UPI0009957B59|nr:facilitated trehalose transporter Tret1-like [Pseudomyrmex gracilis]
MKKVYFAAVAGNIGLLSIGQFYGWASPTLPKLIQDKDADYPVHLTVEEASWIAGLLMFAGVLGCIMCALVVNIIGRKNTMLFAAIPSIISWLLIAYATSPMELYLSRCLSGIASGIAYSATPMYLGEISPPNIRGNLSSMLTVAAKLGTVIEYVIGPFLSVKNLALVSLTGPCLFIITFIWVPESPYQLMRRDNKQKAIKSLVLLRGKEDVYKEAESIERSVKTDLANKFGFREILFVPGNRRALLIKLCLNTLQQMTGIQAIMQYAETIFDMTNSNLESKYLTMILGALQVSCTIICMFFTDCCGRKLLLIISSVGSACSTAIVAVYFTLQHYDIDTSNLVWLPVIGVFMYIIMYNLGLAPLLSTLSGELFSMNIKAFGITLAMAVANIVAFLVTILYSVFAETFGVHVPFWIFSVNGFLAALFVFLYLPETKGKTLQQIQEKLNKPPKK